MAHVYGKYRTKNNKNVILIDEHFNNYIEFQDFLLHITDSLYYKCRLTAFNLNYDEFIQAGLAASRQLGKRQLTWLRAMPSRVVIDPSDHDFIAKAIPICLDHLQQFK
jgi:tRNA A37 N6-isopentenylltransferase MiaA